MTNYELNNKQLTLIITILVTIIGCTAYFLLKLTDSYFLFLLVLASVFIVNYLIIRFLLRKYIFRKIHLIYKLILDSKKDKSSVPYNENLDDVNTQVKEWAETTKEEISSLKSLEEYRKKFLGNVSHELKTPIFSIQSYLHTLLEGGLYDESINKDFLKRALKNSNRLQEIVEDLVTINELESGSKELEFQRFDVKELVNEVCDDLRLIAKKNKISLKSESSNTLSLWVEADKESIRKVLINLIVNGINYGKSGGKVSVSFYDINTETLVEISDDGIGIDEKHIRFIFDRFYRQDTSRSREHGGSGLGLSIVKHIIEAHNQTINVRSTPGIGTTFGFTLAKAE